MGIPGTVPEVVLSDKTLDTIMKRVRFIVDENALVSELRKARHVVKYSLLDESGVRALYKTIEKAGSEQMPTGFAEHHKQMAAGISCPPHLSLTVSFESG